MKVSEETIRAIIDASPDTMMLLDKHGFLDCNPATLKMFGCSTVDEFIGRHPSEYSPPTQADGRSSLEASNEKISVAYEAGSNLFEWDHQRINGEVFPAEVQLNLLKLEEGDILQATVRDTTEQKRAEDKLKKDRQLFSTLFESAADYALILEIQDSGPPIIVDANNAAFIKHGYSREEMIGKPITLLDTKSSAKQVKKRLGNIEKGGIVHFEVEHVCKDGSTFVAESASNLMIVGEKHLFFSIERDITERKQAEESLKNAEAHSRGIIESAKDAFISMDAGGIITEWNPEAERMFGFIKDEAMGSKMSDTIVPEEYRKMHEAGLKQYLKTGDSKVLNKTIEIHALRKSGDQFPVELSIVPLVDNRGEISFNAFIRDLTERIKAQEALRRSEAGLKNSLIGTIGAVCKAVEVRDPYTAGHQVRVSRLARTIAQELGLDSDQIEGVRMGATIHDIGKIQAPSEILSKPSKLNELEYSLIKDHAKVGYEILKDIEFPWPIADIAYQHHERMDGTGYPQGLKGDEICIEARIVAVADVVESMASHRPYRAALGIEAALNEIMTNRGKLYDADVVDACLKVFKEKKFDFDEVRLKGI